MKLGVRIVWRVLRILWFALMLGLNIYMLLAFSLTGADRCLNIGLIVLFSYLLMGDIIELSEIIKMTNDGGY